VQAGEILAHYRLRPEAFLHIRRRLSPPQIPELEVKLAEVERGLNAARDKERGLKTLTQEKLAASQSLAQATQEVKALSRSQAALAHSLARERELAQEDRHLLADQLGEPVSSGRLPREAALRAPIAGRVLWLHPDLRPGAVLKGEDMVALVGVMDPVLVRARVHELELAKLKPGDEAQVTFESLPGRTFTARLSRLPWASPTLTPEQPPYYEVEFELPNPELLLKEGLKANLLIRKEK
jgi:multidrug resistance efflux pump